MLPVKSEIKSVEVSYVETKSFLIKIPSLKIPLHYLKVGGICISLGLLFVVLTSLDTPVVEERNISQEVLTDTVVSAMGIVESVEQVEAVEEEPVEKVKKVIPITNIVRNKKVLDFICHNQVLQRAYQVQKSKGLSVATIIGQKGVESNWNNSSLCKSTKNYGNIKCKCNWDKGLRAKHSKTKECVRAWDKIEKSNHYYVKLSSNWEGWKLYDNLIGKRYMKAASQKEVYDQLVWLKKKQYATDKNYVNTIWNVIKQNNLMELQRHIDEGYTITTTNGKYILLEQ